MGNNEKQVFNYRYSAKEQQEIENIRKKYSASSEEENKLEKLRRLDAGVTKKAIVVSLIVGIIGALIMGLGMSFTMSDLGNDFGTMAMPIGIIIGVVGIVIAGIAYPIYNGIVKKERAKIAPEILRLSEELMK